MDQCLISQGLQSWNLFISEIGIVCVIFILKIYVKNVIELFIRADWYIFGFVILHS